MAEKAPAPTGGGVRVREGDSMPASANTVAQLALETARNARETAEAQAEAQAQAGAHDDDEDRGVRAGINMIKRLWDWNSLRESDGKPPVEMGLG